jgi:hypothetical protein
MTVPEPFSYLARRFCTPGTGSAFTASTNAVPILSSGTAQEVGPLTSSPPSRGQSSGGALWRAVYAPGDGQTSLAYSSKSVQCLYINHLLSVNKLVLLYLLLRLLPQFRFNFVFHEIEKTTFVSTLIATLIPAFLRPLFWKDFVQTCRECI